MIIAFERSTQAHFNCDISISPRRLKEASPMNFRVIFDEQCLSITSTELILGSHAAEDVFEKSILQGNCRKARLNRHKTLLILIADAL